MIEEIAQLSKIMNDYFIPQKLNIGALGNVVSQLHIHAVARYSHDSLWPHGIWQAYDKGVNYSKGELEVLLLELGALVKNNSLLK